MILILIFAEVLGKIHPLETEIKISFTDPATGLYGLIVALLMNSKATAGVKPC